MNMDMYAQSKAFSFDSKDRMQTIETMIRELNDSYVFPEVAKRMENDIRSRLKNGEYDKLTDGKAFAEKLTNDLRSISHDKHISVRFSEEINPPRSVQSEPSAEEIVRFKESVKMNNFAFEKVEWLPGNIGYLRFRGFIDPESGAETVAAAMNFISNTDALIIDLRKNGGGDPAMVALICSYLFGDKKVHLNDLYWRKGDRTEEYWTDPNVLGKKYLDKDVYVLTSGRTFSGAEEFSNNLKVLKRAVIIGETTGGGANPGSLFRLGDHFSIFIPTGRAINPITKTNWEGTGVEPDIKVSQEVALETAYLTALKKAFETTKIEEKKNALRPLIEKAQKELDEMKGKIVEK